MYQFIKVPSIEGSNIYSNEYFHRDKKSNYKFIHRKTSDDRNRSHVVGGELPFEEVNKRRSKGKPMSIEQRQEFVESMVEKLARNMDSFQEQSKRIWSKTNRSISKLKDKVGLLCKVILEQNSNKSKINLETGNITKKSSDSSFNSQVVSENFHRARHDHQEEPLKQKSVTEPAHSKPSNSSNEEEVLLNRNVSCPKRRQKEKEGRCSSSDEMGESGGDFSSSSSEMRDEFDTFFKELKLKNIKDVEMQKLI